MIKAKRTGARQSRKRAAKLVVLEGGKRPISDDRTGPVTVPTIDARGNPMPDWRIARWHLECAANLLGGAYLRERGKHGADAFARASSIARQVSAALDPRAECEDGAALLKMARAVRRRPKIAKADAERRLLEVLPVSADEARRGFIEPLSADFGEDAERQGTMHLAQGALGILAAHHHADSARVLRRWGVPSDSQQYLGSEQYQKDAEELASAIVELLDATDDSRNSFAERLVQRMYRLLGLHHPLEALKKKQRRTRT